MSRRGSHNATKNNYRSRHNVATNKTFATDKDKTNKDISVQNKQSEKKQDSTIPTQTNDLVNTVIASAIGGVMAGHINSKINHDGGSNAAHSRVEKMSFSADESKTTHPCYERYNDFVNCIEKNENDKSICQSLNSAWNECKENLKNNA